MSERLSADDWIRAGLKALAKEGFPVVKADLLAKSLGVSRGSFYWHFKNIEMFHLAVMQRWQDLATEAIIRQVESSASGTGRLSLLMQLAFSADSAIEIGIRAWATSYKPALSFVDKVDLLRLNYMEQILVAAGVGSAHARPRAQIIYWTYLGSMLSGQHVSGPARDSLINELAMLTLEKPANGRLA